MEESIISIVESFSERKERLPDDSNFFKDVKSDNRSTIKSIGFAELKAEAKSLLEIQDPIKKVLPSSFPIDVFPDEIQEIINATNQCLGFPLDFIGSSILLSASLAIGNTHKVEVIKGWQETGALYVALVGRAGTNKSHPLSFALQPILEQDKRTFRKYENERLHFEENSRLSKEARKENNIDLLVKPVWQKSIVSDFTPEALAQVHKFNKRGIGVYVDELAGWFKNFNRYHKGGEQEFWLSVWSGKPINIDRKTGEPVFISHPFISVVGTIQNGVLHQMGKESRTQNGFIDRILFAFPDNLEKPYWSDSEISQSIIDKWTNVILRILELSFNVDENLSPKSEIISFSDQAWDILKAWQITNTDLINSAENEHIASIYSKLEMYAVRIALILEMIFWSCGESHKQTISSSSVKGAIKLVEYFRQSAEKVYSIISNVNPTEKLAKDRKNLYESLPYEFTTEIGLQVAKLKGVSERTFKRFLKDNELFERIKQGEYERRY
jgi:hypothetical protein